MFTGAGGSGVTLTLVQDLQILSVVFYIAVIAIVLTLIYEERDPSTTLAWILVFIMLPGLGLVLYFLFGRNWRRLGRRNRRRQESRERGHRVVRPLYERYAPQATAALADYPLATRIARAIQTQNGTRPLPCARLEIMVSGAEKFERLYKDIESARHHVHLEYFIWEDDELTKRFCDLLEYKVAEGVEVRVLYDWVGSLPYSKRGLRRLEAAGARVRADAAQWHKVNYRNHRKIAVIDGSVAYTGGMNMGAEYVDGGSRFATWRDTHLRFGGPLVLEMQRLFCQRWYEATTEDLFSEEYFREPDAADPRELVWAQVAISGPESQWEAIRQAFVLGIASADSRVWMQSPYFVPDQGVMDAMVSQSLAGVDVRFMMTAHPDKKLAWYAAFSYLHAFTHAGGRAYQYEAGFFHCKALTIDGRIAVLGTTNVDIRSFMLHDELSVFFYDEGVAAAQDALFEEDLALCRRVTSDSMHDEGRLVHFRNALARLTSRML